MVVYVLALAILLLIALHSLFKRAQNSVNVSLSTVMSLYPKIHYLNMPYRLLATSRA